MTCVSLFSDCFTEEYPDPAYTTSNVVTPTLSVQSPPRATSPKAFVPEGYKAPPAIKDRGESLPRGLSLDRPPLDLPPVPMYQNQKPSQPSPSSTNQPPLPPLPPEPNTNSLHSTDSRPQPVHSRPQPVPGSPKIPKHRTAPGHAGKHAPPIQQVISPAQLRQVQLEVKPRSSSLNSPALESQLREAGILSSSPTHATSSSPPVPKQREKRQPKAVPPVRQEHRPTPANRPAVKARGLSAPQAPARKSATLPRDLSLLPMETDPAYVNQTAAGHVRDAQHSDSDGEVCPPPLPRTNRSSSDTKVPPRYMNVPSGDYEDEGSAYTHFVRP